MTEERIGLRGFRVRQPQEADARRRAILLAAAKVFSEKGYWRATLEDIAREMGTTKGLFYYYFKSKEEIYTEIMLTSARDSLSRVEAAAGEGGTTEETLRRMIRTLLINILHGLDYYAVLILDHHAVSAENRARNRDLERRHEQIFREVVERGMSQGVFARRDPAIATFTLLRAVMGVANWYAPDGRLAPEYIAGEVIEQVMAGLREPTHAE